jgi:fructoselysine-6-P-deglycase FrlB-like protein/translation initiation factor 2B subunit (eIF-2B alpha/beta/delta family)
MPEKRFKHVEELSKAGLSAPDAQVMHYLWQIVDEGVLGASKHVALGNELLLHILDSVPDRDEALLRARLVSGFIAGTRGRDTPVIGNSLALLLGGLDDVAPGEQAQALRARIANWTKTAGERKARLVDTAVRHLSQSRGVMAFDYSSTVAAIIIALARANPDLVVVVPESRSIAGGARYLEEFLPAGLSVRYVPDAAIEYALHWCDAALFGVETLRSDGSFLNTIGSRMIARLAKFDGVEVYGCTDMLKLDMRSYDGHRPAPAVRSYDHPLLDGLAIDGLARADTQAPELEVIPADLVTGLLTEHGVVPPPAIWSLGKSVFGHEPSREIDMINEMMAREIAAQPQVLAQCIAPLAEAIRMIERPTGRIFAGGCGDSAFAPKALGGVFAALDIEIEPKTSMELASFTRLRSGDTVILSSISGGTKRTVEAAVVARDAGARVIALTCNRGSALDVTANETIILPFTPLSRKTPHTLDYAVTLLALGQLALHWRGLSPGEAGAVVASLPEILTAGERQAAEIATRMNSGGKIVLLGAGPDIGTAEYGAAKFHEAGGLIAIAAETENFIHGMNFILEPQDTLLALASNAAGLKRGKQVVDAFKDFLAQAEVIGQPAEVDWWNTWRSTLSGTILLQQICLALAERRALPLEEPRAGRKNGTAHLGIQSHLMSA